MSTIIKVLDACYYDDHHNNSATFGKTLVMSDTHLAAPTGFIEAGCGQFAHRRWSPASGSPLFLVRHFRGGVDRRDHLLTDGFAEGRDAILFNGRGIGPSTGMRRNRIEDMADDIALAIRALDLSQFNLLGLSIGGMQKDEAARHHPVVDRKPLLLGASLRHANPSAELKVLERASNPVPTVDDFLYLFFGRSDAVKEVGLAKA
jgi:pimeloyl-ACP methyl ester carboxylesterase